MKLSATLGLLVLLASSHARADAESEARRLLDAGTALFDAGSFTAAREAFAKARDLVPDKPNPYRWLGITDARLGRCAQALAELDEFIARVPRSDRRLVEVETLRERCAVEAARGAPVPSPAVPPDTSPGSAALPSASRVNVCVISPHRWSYCDGNGNPIAEHEFARRYAEATHAHELDRVRAPKKTGYLVSGILLAAGSALIIAGGAAMAGGDSHREAFTAGLVLSGIGFNVDVAALFVGFPVAASAYKKELYYRHGHGEAEAHRLAAAHNLALSAP